MGIVLKWNFKNLFADTPRLVLTILSIAVTFALLTGTGVTLGSFALATASINEGVPQLLETMLAAILQAVFAVTLYAMFSVSLAERKNQYRIMSTVGCTTRQLLHGLMTEALSLDMAGALIGVALGFLLAGWQLKTGGFPLIGEVFWDRAVWLKNILPAFLIVPLAMLAASIQLFRPARDRRRRRGLLRRKSAFRRRLPRLFGTGGTLEYALAENDRRHHGALVLSLGVNLAVVMLLTACLYYLANSTREASEWDVWISYFSVSGGDSTLTARLDGILEKGLRDGSVKERAETESYLAHCYALLDNGQMTDEVFNYYRNTPEETQGSADIMIHPFDQNRQLLFFSLFFLDDVSFERLAEEKGIDLSDNGAILAAFTGLRPYGMIPLLRQPPAVLTLRFSPWDIWERVGSFYTKQAVFDPVPLRETPSSRIVSVPVPIDGSVSFQENDWMFDYGITMNLGGEPALMLPVRLRNHFGPLLTGDGVVKSRYLRIRTDSPEALCERLRESLNGLDGYEMVDFRFGDGTSQLFADASLFDGVKNRTVMNRVRINNVRAEENDYRVFLEQIDRFYRVVLLLVVFAVGLNILNTVHLNRLSRRQEYAVLASIGLDRRHRRQMLLTESLRYSVKGALLAFLLTIVAVYPLSLPINSALNWEYMQPPSFLLGSSSDTRFEMIHVIMIIAKSYWDGLAYIWTRYWPPIVGIALFLFFGFLLAEHLTLKKLEKDELVMILKDDFYE